MVNTENLTTILSALNYANVIVSNSPSQTTEASRKAHIFELFSMEHDVKHILNPFNSITDRLASINLDEDDLADEDDDAISVLMSLSDSAISSYIAGETGAFSIEHSDYKNDINGNDHVKLTITMSNGDFTLTIPVILITFRDKDTWCVEESSYNEHVNWTISSSRPDSENGLILSSIKDACKEEIVDFLVSLLEIDFVFDNLSLDNEVKQAKETIALYSPVAELADKLLLDAISRGV